MGIGTGSQINGQNVWTNRQSLGMLRRQRTNKR